MCKFNGLESGSNIMSKILSVKKPKFLAQVFLKGATMVMCKRISYILIHLKMPPIMINKHVKAVQQDFAKVSEQVIKDLALCQIEDAIVADVERA